MIGLIATVVVFPIIGLAARRVIGPVNPFLAGAGIMGSVLFCAGIVHMPLTIAAILVVASAIAVIAVRPPLAIERQTYPRLPTLLAIVPAIWLLILTAVVPLHDYDGIAFWLLKAKAIAHEQSVDGPFFSGSTVSPRNSYPLLLPTDAALLMTIGGTLDERHVGWLYACFPIALAAEMRRRLGQRFSPAIGAWSAALLLWLPQILVRQDGGSTSAYADVPLAAFVACAFFEIVDAISPARLALWLPCIVLTKSEGLPLAALLALIGAIVFRRRIWTAETPFFVSVALLFAWRTRVQRSDEHDFLRLVFSLPSHWERYRASLGEFALQAVKFSNWGLLGLVLLASVALLAIRRRWHPLLLAGAVALPMIALYAAVFAVTRWDPIDMTYLAPRLQTHLIGIVLFVIATALHGEAASRANWPSTRSPQQRA